LRFTDLDGLRLACFATNSEVRIRNARDTDLRNLPLHDTAQNQIWLEIVRIAPDFLAWMPTLALTAETRRWEPERLGLRLFSSAAQLITTGRRWLGSGTVELRRPPDATAGPPFRTSQAQSPCQRTDEDS
jgi:hypothetical protein